MMVISDNSALSALAEIGMLDLLPRLFSEVVIPEAVWQECTHPRAPLSLRDWIKNPPDWLHTVNDLDTILPETHGLGAGEAAAITLAWSHKHLSKLILDEKRGRRVAQALGLPMSGVVGIIGTAAKLGWIDFDDAVERLTKTGFHISGAVVIAVKQKLKS